MPGGVRLQKVLAAAGVGSRRHCEELIGPAGSRWPARSSAGRRPGGPGEPDHPGGRQAHPSRQDVVYLAFNKPVKVLTAMTDDRGRATITDFLGDRAERLFHVGRLDYDTEGLMLLTNDGELAHRLAHPSYEVAKTYLADVPGPIRANSAGGSPLGSNSRTGWRWRTSSASSSRLRARPGRDHAARGAQSHRPPDAGRGRPSGQPPGADVGRADQAGKPDARQHQGPHHQGDRRAVRRRRPVAERHRAPARPEAGAGRGKRSSLELKIVRS